MSGPHSRRRRSRADVNPTAEERCDGRDNDCDGAVDEEGLTPCYACTDVGPAITCTAPADPYACEGYRLPTEAEWEYAAKADESYTDSESDAAEDVAWIDENSGATTHAVAGKVANACGLYDMSGNVWEWTHDWFAAYASGAVVDPTGPATGSYRVWRGGTYATP